MPKTRTASTMTFLLESSEEGLPINPRDVEKALDGIAGVRDTHPGNRLELVEDLLKMLSRLEYAGSSPMYGESQCPICQALYGEHSDHAEDCKLDALFKRVDNDAR